MRALKTLLVLMFLLWALSPLWSWEQSLSSRAIPFTGGTLTSNLIISTGTKILLPLGTYSPAGLGIAFIGDEDTGMNQWEANRISFYAANQNVCDVTQVDFKVFKNLSLSGSMSMISAGKAYIPSSFATPTLPIYTYVGDDDSGVGRKALGNPSLISDGVECIRVASSGTQIFQVLTTPQFLASSTTPVATTTFPTTGFTYASGGLDVYVGGIHQRPSSDYTETSSSLITFTTLIATGTPVDIHRK